MTNEEAKQIIEIHRNSLSCVDWCDGWLSCFECAEAFDMAIKALEFMDKQNEWRRSKRCNKGRMEAKK